MLRPEIWCHETFHEDTFLHIEDNTFSGWIASKHKIKEIRLGDNKVIVSRRHRQDVIDDYRFNKGIELKEAWEIQFSVHSSTEAYDPIYIVYEDETGTDINAKLGTLEKFYIYYSGFNNTNFKNIVVMEDFYDDPMAVRNFALNNMDFVEKDSHRGISTDHWTLDGTQEKFEYILDKKILNFNDPGYRNGAFQYIYGADPIVHHVDENSYAGIIYLTPDAPVECGTSFYTSKITGKGWYNHAEWQREEYEKVFEENFYNRHMFEEVDRVGNVFNRLVIWDSFKIHAATQHFGTTPFNSRFFHIFFFDVEE